MFAKSKMIFLLSTSFLLAIFACYTYVSFSPKVVIAQTPTGAYLSGYAWSENIGWISFATSTYNPNGVTLDSSGNLSGYAWSENIGWIQFGDGLSGFPGGLNTINSSARFNGTNLVGWAKALSANGNGWDGWISFSGSTTSSGSYGVSQSGASLSGYAWGSDVVGWVQFNSLFGGVSVLNVAGVCGSAQGGQTTSAPITNLCTTGQASSVVNPSPSYLTYTWSCSSTNGGATAQCYSNRVCGAGQIISQVDGACINSTCSSSANCGGNGYSCVNSKCLQTSTTCTLDGLTLPNNGTSTFFSSRVSKSCTGVSISCDSGTLVGNISTYKYKKCITPAFKEF